MLKNTQAHMVAGREWLKQHEQQVIFAIALIVVGALGFEAGMVFGRSKQSLPIVIEKPLAAASENSVPQEQAQNASSVLGNSRENQGKEKNQAVQSVEETSKCAFVGSRNSDKYHDPSCPVVKRIKAENRVCFTSEEDAKGKGYQAGCLGSKK